jgi:hypothetical protein
MRRMLSLLGGLALTAALFGPPRPSLGPPPFGHLQQRPSWLEGAPPWGSPQRRPALSSKTGSCPCRSSRARRGPSSRRLHRLRLVPVSGGSVDLSSLTGTIDHAGGLVVFDFHTFRSLANETSTSCWAPPRL